MRSYRKRNGFNSMEKIIKSMFSDTPLVMNLENKDYMKILLDGKKILEERFAEIDSKDVREEIKRMGSESDIVPPKIKKIIKIPEFPESLVYFIGRMAS